MSILTTKEALELLSNTPMKISVTSIFIVLCIIAFLFIKEHLEVRKNYLNDRPISKFHEIPAKLMMPVEELFDYFKIHYGFNIGEDSYKLIDKAKSLITRVTNLHIELNNDLLAAQTGVVTNKSEIINRVNESGALTIIVDNELNLMIKLFSFLNNHDITYNEELSEIIELRKEYKIMEKDIIALSMSLITELPTN